MPTLVCVSIAVETLDAALDEAAAAKAARADLVEFRVDGFFSGSHDPAEFRRIVRLVTQSPLPCIVTCRPVSEGGHYDGEDAARVALFEALGTASGGGGGSGSLPPRFLDVELATYQRSANLKQKVNLAVGHPGQVRDLSTSLILSSHDFNGRPPDLSRRVLAMADEPAAAVLKIAYRARSVRDNLELFDLLAENAGGKPMIALAMGEFGLLSRVLAPKFGAFLTFATLRPEAATAPGQPTIRELLDVYRFRSIGRATRVFGVIGWPLAHSRSPILHNAAFAATGADSVFVPIPVPPEYEHFKASLHALIDHPRLDFSGCAVTIPHKEHLLRFARERAAAGEPWTLDPLATRCGAANTLTLERDQSGRLTAASVRNTDGPAAVTLLTTARGPLSGRRIALLGAGGAARAIAAAAGLAGATLTIHNRTPPRAEELVRSLGLDTLSAAPLAQVAATRPDAIINCTPVGMAGGPAPNASPIDEGQLRACPPGTVVFDTVYSPRETPFLRLARQQGRPTIEGLEMLLEQAADQFYPADAATKASVLAVMRSATQD